MLEYLTLLLVCQLVGEFAVSIAGIPIPGPVAGMIFLFIFLSIKGNVPDELATVANSLLNNLSLLFVPAGVGVIVHFELLGADAAPLSAALILSTILTITVTALVMTRLNKLSSGTDDQNTAENTNQKFKDKRASHE